MIIMAEEFLTPDEVATKLRLTEDSVTRMLRQGKMPGYKIEGSWRIDRQEFEEYLKAKRNTRADKKN